MPRADVYMVSDKRQLATEGQIAAAEATLKTRFPPGYRDYMFTFGAGYLNGTARVLPPTEIVGQTAEFRDRMQLLYGNSADGPPELLDAPPDLLPPERVFECILLIDAGGGHEIIYRPEAPDEIFWLPHDHDRIDYIGHTVDEALDWFLRPGRFEGATRVLAPESRFVRHPIRWFEPDRETSKAEFVLPDSVAFAEVREYFVSLTQQHAESALCISKQYFEHDRLGIEELRFFDRNYGEAILCRYHVTHPDIYMEIAFDADRRNEQIDAVIAHWRRLARAQINDEGISVPL